MPFEPFLALPQLRTFYGVALERSFSAAAERLGRTPSAVSHAIRTLEEAAGIRLVERRGRTVRLTEAGEHLFATCTAVYGMLEDAGDALRRAGTVQQRRIRLGAPPEFGCSVLMRLIAPFLKDNPDLEIDFRLSRDLLTPLQRDEVDVVIDCVEHLQPDLLVTPLFRETYMVVCSPTFRREHRVREPTDLSTVTILSLDKPGTWWNRLLRALPERKRPEFRRITMANHVRAMISAAGAGMGVALVPSYSVRTEVERGLLVQLFPHIGLPEDRFRIYQKKVRAALDRHRRLVAFLQSVEPSEFGLERRP
jgi:DNA-binding transcriptional LysR family regulator